MLGKALYYPTFDIADSAWLRSAILFWDEVQTIVPSSVGSPYANPDTRICASEGYLRPLRCDFYPDLIEELGSKVIALLQEPEWRARLLDQDGADRVNRTVLSGDKLAENLRWHLREQAGIHPARMSPDLRFILANGNARTLMSEQKLSARLREFSRNLNGAPRDYAHEGEVIVTGRFARFYMSALAALLARKSNMSALTDIEACAGVNLRCLLEDVGGGGENAARGAVVSLVMENLRIDPATPIQRLIAFRKGREEQLAELAGHFDDLKGKIEKASTADELREGAQRLYQNKIAPGLHKLKKELEAQSVQSVWEGVQRGVTVSAAGTGALAYITGYTGPMLLGAAAFITVADVAIKSHFAKRKARASSPYSYLLEVQERFALPAGL